MFYLFLLRSIRKNTIKLEPARLSRRTVFIKEQHCFRELINEVIISRNNQSADKINKLNISLADLTKSARRVEFNPSIRALYLNHLGLPLNCLAKA